MNPAGHFPAWAESSVGKVRKRNEDAFLIMPEKSIFLVADGMGGHKRGDVAAQLCVESVREFFAGCESRKTLIFFRKLFDMPFDGRAAWEKNICAAIEYANRKIYGLAVSSHEYSGMGTTVVAIGLSGTRLFAAWCGDSRIYRFREGRLSLVSDDHSLVNQYVKAGMLTPDQARDFPHRNVILQALGLNESLKYEWIQRRTMPGDVYLLCSDGLNDMITDQRIEDVLKEQIGGHFASPHPLAAGENDIDRDILRDASDALIDAAMKEGGVDNITALLVAVASDAVDA
jgi:protein phosphatase